MNKEIETLYSITGIDSKPYITVLPFNEGSRSRNNEPSIVELGKQLLKQAKLGKTNEVRDLMCRGAPFTTDQVCFTFTLFCLFFLYQ